MNRVIGIAVFQLFLLIDGTWGFLSEKIISDRIDFIYYKGPGIKTRFSKIVKDDPLDGFFNSDHRAILSNFQIGE